MSVKPDPNLPSDGLARGKKPATAVEKRAIRRAVKAWPASSVTIVKRPVFFRARVPTWCVECGRKGDPRRIHPREAHDFLHLHVPKQTPRAAPYYGACPKHEEIVRETAASYEPTREERYILECCRRAGVDSITLLFDAVREVRRNRLKKLRKDAKKSHARRAGLLRARELYPRAGWGEWVKMTDYPTVAAAKRDYFRACKEQGVTKPKE